MHQKGRAVTETGDQKESEVGENPRKHTGAKAGEPQLVLTTFLPLPLCPPKKLTGKGQGGINSRSQSD